LLTPPRSQSLIAAGQRGVGIRVVRRGAGRAFTLVEVLVVVALIAILSGTVLFSGGMLGSSRLRGATTLIASAVRLGIARANTTGHAGRLVLDLDNDKVVLEEATGSVMLREKKKPAGGAEAATDAEKMVKAESDRILDGPHAPRTSFHPVAGFSDTPTGRELGKGVDITRVQTEHDEQPVTEGRGYIYFWPGGLTERAHVQLKRAGSEDALTVVVSPLTGRTKIEKGLIDLPEPRTDKEEDQGDREAL
jgi:general secretion pathway protein H